MESDFARVLDWSLQHRRPILLSEFGAYEQPPLQSRALYTARVARTSSFWAGHGPTGSTIPISSSLISTKTNGQSPSEYLSSLRTRVWHEGLLLPGWSPNSAEPIASVCNAKLSRSPDRLFG